MYEAAQTIYQATLAEIRDAGLYKEERIITTPQGAQITASPRAGDPPREVLNFCANNYLGLSSHPDVIAAAKRAIDTHGFGLSSVRFICGTQDIHKRLEARIAAFHGQEDAILYPSCFDANAGLFEAILGPDDAIISDELNHASIIDGVRLCKAARHRYKHADVDDLDAKLTAAAGARVKLVATDGVFSMDGTVAPLPDIMAVARKHGALVFIDECHGTGVIGAGLRGTDEYWGMHGAPDIVNSTLGKVRKGGGVGWAGGDTRERERERQRARLPCAL